VNPISQGKIDACKPFVPLSQFEPLPWDDPIKRLAYYRAKRAARDTRLLLEKSRADSRRSEDVA
jgi:hypothetical protein